MKLAANNAPTLEVTYKEHRIVVSSVGKGWRAMIYPPASSAALPESPATLEQCTKEAIIAEAKSIVDARCSIAPNT